MPKFKHKPFEIEAIQYTGVLSDNIRSFLQGWTWDWRSGTGPIIATLDGVLNPDPYDWIIKDNGRIYSMNSKEFQDTYDLIPE